LKVKEKGAKVYVSDDFRIMIFAEKSTGQKDNTMRAVSSAKILRDYLSSHNKTRSVKIDFGIGMNAGDMIIEGRGGKFKFTSLGSTISVTKKLAGMSKGDLLISEGLHGKVVGKVKAKKNPGNYWTITQVSDRAEHEEFVNRFLQRQKGEKQ
jgi:class 3 adenylate cyclase